VPLLSYSPGAQAWFYAVSLLAVSGLLAAIFWLSSVDRFGKRLAGGALGVLLVTMLIGRDLVVYTGTVQQINFGLYLFTLGLVAAGLWRLRTDVSTVLTQQSTSSD
jgi:cytochrome c oxidase assembly protein subunit 15